MKSKTKYIFKILRHLFEDSDLKKFTSAEIAHKLNIPSEYTAKLMQELAKKDYLISKKGKHGGFMLNPTLKEVKFGKVIDELKLLTGLEEECFWGFETCIEKNGCEIKRKKNELFNIIREKKYQLIKNKGVRMKQVLIYMLSAFLIVACSSNDSSENKKNADNGKKSKKEKIAERFGISLFELDNGIGPVKEKLKLGPIDQSKVKLGEKTFNEKCTQCHKLDERYTGPALRGVLERRTPEYVLNMIMNPQEMTQKHPEARKLLAQFATQMTFQNVTMDDAKNILEFLRNSTQKK